MEIRQSSQDFVVTVDITVPVLVTERANRIGRLSAVDAIAYLMAAVPGLSLKAAHTLYTHIKE